MLRCFFALTAFWVAAINSLAAADKRPEGSPPLPPPTAQEIRQAVTRILPLLQKGAAGHREHRTCFACHNQALPILALTTARSRGLAIDEDDLRQHLEFIDAFLEKNRDNFLKGRGTGGQVDTAGYALWTLEMGGWKPNATTAAVAEYLLLYNKDLDHWRNVSNRPPSEASPFTASYLALRGLQSYGTAEQKERIAQRTGAIRGWLRKMPGKDTEDRVFRLWAMKRASVEPGVVKEAAQALLASQFPNGGWSQIDSLEPDAYATGSVLVALHQAGDVATTDPAYQRGLRFLVQTQREDGSWYVHSRSKPFQLYFESGFPHGKDQFISIAASGWATTALALALPPVTR